MTRRKNYFNVKPARPTVTKQCENCKNDYQQYADTKPSKVIIYCAHCLSKYKKLRVIAGIQVDDNSYQLG